MGKNNFRAWIMGVEGDLNRPDAVFMAVSGSIRESKDMLS